MVLLGSKYAWLWLFLSFSSFLTNLACVGWITDYYHCVKSVQIWSFFWSECGKMWNRNNSVFEHFSSSVRVKKRIIKLWHADLLFLILSQSLSCKSNSGILPNKFCVAFYIEFFHRKSTILLISLKLRQHGLMILFVFLFSLHFFRYIVSLTVLILA